MATAKYASGRREQLSSEQLFAAAQCELVPAFLPAELAGELLARLMADEAQWDRMQWHIGGRLGQSNKTSCKYELPDARNQSAPGQVGGYRLGWL